MSGWQDATLGEVCELKRGYDLPKRDRRDGPYPIVSSSGTTGWHAEAKVKGPGVVTGRYGTLGEVFLVDEDFWPLNTSLYVRDFKGNDPRFVAALLESMNLGQHDGAAAVPGLNRNQLHKLPVRCPDLSDQRRVSDILGSIDDMIENNRRRIEVLEEMAQAIYREWFVHFRYPGHEDVTFVDSPLGPIPEGWEALALHELADLTMGQSPKSVFYNDTGDGSPFHQGVKDFGSHFPTHRTYCTVEGRAVTDGDVLISVRAPVGRLNIAPSDLTIGRGLAAARAKSGQQSLLFYALKLTTFAVEDSMGSGTIFKAITKKDLANLRLPWPPTELAVRADLILTPMVDQIRSLTSSSTQLTAMRDLLLPKLVTGEIDVSELDLGAQVGAAS